MMVKLTDDNESYCKPARICPQRGLNTTRVELNPGVTMQEANNVLYKRAAHTCEWRTPHQHH